MEYTQSDVHSQCKGGKIHLKGEWCIVFRLLASLWGFLSDFFSDFLTDFYVTDFLILIFLTGFFDKYLSFWGFFEIFYCHYAIGYFL